MKVTDQHQVPRPCAAPRRSADSGWNRNCRGRVLSVDSTQHLLNCCRCTLTLIDYRVVV